MNGKTQDGEVSRKCDWAAYKRENINGQLAQEKAVSLTCSQRGTNRNDIELPFYAAWSA